VTWPKMTKGPGDFSPPEPDASCDGCGLDGCAECESYCKRHCDNNDDKCMVFVECGCGVDFCCEHEEDQCPKCGMTVRDEDWSGDLDPAIEARLGGER
jgi:hypothetical protein